MDVISSRHLCVRNTIEDRTTKIKADLNGLFHYLVVFISIYPHFLVLAHNVRRNRGREAASFHLRDHEPIGECVNNVQLAQTRPDSYRELSGRDGAPCPVPNVVKVGVFLHSWCGAEHQLHIPTC